MRTSQYIILSIALALTAAPAGVAQNNAKEITGRKQAELIEILKSPKATEFEKAKACQRLAVVGTKDAVPALAALLPDERLNCYARSGLEGIADPAADEALREAAAKLHGRQLVGVLISIGQRRDAKAVDLLGKLLTDKDETVASAAAARSAASASKVGQRWRWRPSATPFRWPLSRMASWFAPTDSKPPAKAGSRCSYTRSRLARPGF